jgi:hypothetical protein
VENKHLALSRSTLYFHQKTIKNEKQRGKLCVPAQNQSREKNFVYHAGVDYYHLEVRMATVTELSER